MLYVLRKMKKWDLKTALRFRIFANSKYVAQRIKSIYQREQGNLSASEHRFFLLQESKRIIFSRPQNGFV
jgi:hypothetical protein